MPRSGLNRELVVELALEMLDDGEGLGLTALAERAGVKTPSLYNHVAGLGDLENAVAIAIMDQLTQALDGPDTTDSTAALLAIMHRYRAWAVAHPQRYRRLPMQPLQEPRLRTSADALLAVFARACGAKDGVLRGDDIHRIRGLRAAAHGFVLIELGGGFGMAADIDESYKRMLLALLD